MRCSAPVNNDQLAQRGLDRITPPLERAIQKQKIGLDVNFAVTQSIYRAYFHEPCFQPQPIQQRMVDANTSGRKTGHGFYEYHTENKP